MTHASPLTAAGIPEATQAERIESLFQALRSARHVKADRVFLFLMLAQWAFAIFLALYVSPYAWNGKVREFHPHLYAAIFMGGGISLFPVLLSILKPGWVVTRHVNVISQMLWSALFIHLTGGRIETHFHVFGSLAFVAFYCEWPLLVTATVVVAGDHLVRGVLFPESVYGITNPEWWRFLEHAAWVLFENVVLAWSCLNGLAEMRSMAERQSQVEALREADSVRSATLEMLLKEMQMQPSMAR
jgi:hypothetical protein